MNPNPALLKFDLAIRGARLGPGVREHPDIAPAAEGHDYAARSLELVLAEDVWVTVPIGDRFTAASPYELRAAGDTFVVDGHGHRDEVRIVPPPRFYGESTRSGMPMHQIGTAYGANVDPAKGAQRVGVVIDREGKIKEWHERVDARAWPAEVIKTL